MQQVMSAAAHLAGHIHAIHMRGREQGCHYCVFGLAQMVRRRGRPAGSIAARAFFALSSSRDRG